MIRHQDAIGILYPARHGEGLGGQRKHTAGVPEIEVYRVEIEMLVVQQAYGKSLKGLRSHLVSCH